MPHSLHVQVFCPDRTGLVAGLTGALFDLDANLGDTRFAVLGHGAEFSAILVVTEDIDADRVRAALAAVPEAADAEITVSPYDDWAGGAGGPEITHRVSVSGGDRPGLVTRLAEVFGDYEANIATLNAQQMPHDPSQYVIRAAVAIPPGRAAACLATVSNTAEALGLTYRIESL
jgi:glycine cleavage system transcriptional repressor